jgi:tryptophanase
MFGHTDPDTGETMPARSELVRLAIPRRVYTQSHVDYAVEAILNVYARRERMGGYRITYEPPFLRHFTARFESLGA